MPSKNNLSALKNPKNKNILPKPKDAKEEKDVRRVKGFYISEYHREMFEQLLLIEKQKNGKKSPVLIEEALDLLFQKYKFKGLNI